MMRSLHGNQQLSNGLCGQLTGLAFCKSKHCALNEVELLLEVIKANACIYLVPVEYLGLIWQLGVGSVWHALEAAVDVLIVENVEQLLEKEAIAKVHREVFYLPTTSHPENFVQQNTQVMRLFQNRPSSCLITGFAFDGNFAAADVHDVMLTIFLNDLGFGVSFAILLINLLILLFFHFLGHLLVVLIVLSLLSIVVTVFHCLSEVFCFFCLFKYI